MSKLYATFLVLFRNRFLKIFQSYISNLLNFCKESARQEKVGDC